MENFLNLAPSSNPLFYMQADLPALQAEMARLQHINRLLADRNLYLESALQALQADGLANNALPANATIDGLGNKDVSTNAPVQALYSNGVPANAPIEALANNSLPNNAPIYVLSNKDVLPNAPIHELANQSVLTNLPIGKLANNELSTNLSAMGVDGDAATSIPPLQGPGTSALAGEALHAHIYQQLLAGILRKVPRTTIRNTAAALIHLSTDKRLSFRHAMRLYGLSERGASYFIAGLIRYGLAERKGTRNLYLTGAGRAYFPAGYAFTDFRKVSW